MPNFISIQLETTESSLIGFVEEQQEHEQGESKKSPLRFSYIFPQTVGDFSPTFTRLLLMKTAPKDGKRTRCLYADEINNRVTWSWFACKWVAASTVTWPSYSATPLMHRLPSMVTRRQPMSGCLTVPIFIIYNVMIAVPVERVRPRWGPLPCNRHQIHKYTLNIHSHISSCYSCLLYTSPSPRD